MYIVVFETKKKEILYESLESKVWIEVDILFCVNYLTYIQLNKNYQNFHPFDFYGYTRLRGVGADLPPPGEIRLKQKNE